MASPPVAALLLLLLVFLAAALLASAPRPTRSAASASDGAASRPEPAAMTFCSGRSTVAAAELAAFLDAVCAGAYRGGGGAASVSTSSHSSEMSENRTMYGVAQCRPGIRAPDCAACLASSSRAIIAAGATAACAAAAVWRDACFLRYADGGDDPAGGSREDDDEYEATVFSGASRRALLSPSYDGREAVTGLLAAAGNRTARSHICGAGGAGATGGTTAAAGGGGRLMIHGLTRCATGVSCADCGRCLRRALAVVEREYNGSAGVQVLRFSCVASYGTYPTYKSTSPSRRLLGPVQAAAASSETDLTAQPTVNVNVGSVSPSASRPTTVGPSRGCQNKQECRGGDTSLPPPPPSPPASAQPAQAPPHAGHTPPFSRPKATPAPLAPLLPGVAHYVSPGSRRKRLIITVTFCISIGVAVVVVVILAGIWFCRKQTTHMGHVADDTGGENMYDDARGEDHSGMEEEEDVEGGRTSCQLYSYQVLEAATCQFSSSNKLGSGGFGTVYKGTLGNGKEVAVKRLRDSKKNIQELERETCMVANLRHKNLVRFLGHCFQEEGRFLVYEYVPNNSLEKFWYKASFQCQRLDWATWHNIIIGIARGLRFLHNKGIIHRDLKPHNVLLDESFNPKIADFDLMRVYDKQKTHESTEKAAGTLGYMAPECTSGRKFLLSIKSDVYSYGVLVLEIITGHKIYTFEGLNSEGLVEYVWQHWTEKRVSEVVDGDLLGVDGHHQEDAARQALRCVHVALLCVQADRSRRPTMGQVIAMLRREEMELQEPSLPGYVSRPTTVASGVPLPCLGCR